MAELSFNNIFFCFFFCFFFWFFFFFFISPLLTAMHFINYNLEKTGNKSLYTIYFTSITQKKGVLEGVNVGILWSYVMVVTGVPGGKPLTLDRRPLPCHKRTSGIEPELQQWQARFSPPALSTPLKKGSHLIKILQAIVFIWLHTCLPFRTNQSTWGVFNNVSDGGTLDVLVSGFTHCKYVALSTNAHLVEHSLGL